MPEMPRFQEISVESISFNDPKPRQSKTMKRKMERTYRQMKSLKRTVEVFN